MLSVALSRGSPRVGVTDHLAVWSPDLPHRATTARRDRPADSPAIKDTAGEHPHAASSHEAERALAGSGRDAGSLSGLPGCQAGPPVRMRQAAGVPWTVVITRQCMIVKALWRYSLPFNLWRP